jgi:nucleoid DNA-binding protein
MPYLIGEVANELDWSKSEVKLCINSFFNIVADELAEGNEVAINPYLKLAFGYRAPVKKGTLVRNPSTGGQIPSAGRPASFSLRARVLSGFKKNLPSPTSKNGKAIVAAKAK